jgi:hypothetical protein
MLGASPGARLLVLLLATALAADPTPARCEAVFLGPTEGCALRGSWAASGFGKSEEQARKNALDRLAAALEAGAAEKAAKAAGTLASVDAEAQQRTCPDAGVEAARVHCYLEPEMEEKRLCFATFDDSGCWRRRMVDLTGPMWKAHEIGRDRVCAAVDDALAAEDAPDERRHGCQARCQQEARVRCPASSD